MLDLKSKSSTAEHIFREAQTSEEIEKLLELCRTVYDEIGISDSPSNLPGPCSFDLIDNFSSHFGLYNQGNDTPFGYIRVTNSDQMAGIEDNYFSIFRYFPGADLIKSICDKIIAQNRTIVEIGRMAILRPFRTRKMMEFLFDAVSAWTFCVKGIEFALAVPWNGLIEHCKEMGFSRFPGSDRPSIPGCGENLECLLASWRKVPVEQRQRFIQLANAFIADDQISLNLSKKLDKERPQIASPRQSPDIIKVA